MNLIIVLTITAILLVGISVVARFYMAKRISKQQGYANAGFAISAGLFAVASHIAYLQGYLPLSFFQVVIMLCCIVFGVNVRLCLLYMKNW
jgi:hypothetical protein